jgi:heat shock protein HslJ
VRPRPHALLLALLLLAVQLGVAGCGASGGNTRALDGTAWRLTAWTTSALDPADFTITAKFADGHVTGDSGVNAYGASYITSSDGSFRVGDLAVTAMGGVGVDMQAEQTYLTLLGEARGFRRSGGTLTLLDQQDRASLTFAAAAP